MDESQDSAAFTALCLAAGPSRAERVRKVLREARETLARCRADELAEPRPDTPTPTWAEERADVLEAIRGLRELCETLHDRLTEMQKGPWHSVYRAIAKWGDEERARIEEESLARKRLRWRTMHSGAVRLPQKMLSGLVCVTTERPTYTAK